MTSAPPARLFRPGDGALPPALTGRGVQQGVLSRCLGDLVAGVAPPHNVVLLGPRGVASVADYYQTRYRELRAEGLLDAAVAVAPLFQDRADATATEPELEAALAGAGDEAGRFAALVKLERLGYVWRPPSQTPPAAWSAGIPSLMTYVLEHATRH